ncbi:MAG: FAD-dependent oxidoreductase, partial [Clostridia bacterium]|nr:FAD-dependent oxidoreductase [Clostridia bacterium]
MERILIEKDLVIVGGGVPGVAHAILSARLGLSVALVQNRGYLGGNSGAEIGVCVCGATGTQEFNYFARETGVIEELILENLHRNPDGNRYIWDGVLMDAVLAESNIELFLNTNVDGADVENGKITRVYGSQNTTGKTFIFSAPLFADDTGDGNLGYLAGAEYRYGREAKSEFGERLAPDVADNHVLSSTLMFCAKNVGHPVAYHAPEFALDLTKTDVLKHRIIPQEGFEKSMWFYEIDGDLDQNAEAETILLHQRALVYGIWDYIKNSGNYNAENYDLEYVSPIMGKRESRRLMGDYILTEKDIAGQTEFPDVVGHGGWSIDLHAIRGFYATEPVNKHVYLKGVYQIPYRCGYSKNIDNLFIEGRCMSTSHVAFGSTRLIATLTTVAQANAAASYLCKKFNTSPRGVYEYHLEELQQLLLRHDQYLIGKPYTEKEDLAKRGTVTVSSVKKLAIEKQDGIKALD